MSDPRPARIAALVDRLSAAHIDGLLLTGLSNIRYLTGFSGSSALLVVTPRDVVLITDFRYQTQVAEEVGDIARIAIEASSLWAGLWTQLATLMSVRLIGFETAHIQHRDFHRLVESGARWQWRPTRDLVEALRERKDEEEIARIAEAAHVATRALGRTLPMLHAGMTELAEEIMGVPVRRGIPRGIGGLVDVVKSPIYATGVGLVVYGARHQDRSMFRIREENVFKKVKRRMGEWLQEVF